jgi:ribose 5-phosphate isomerase B
MHTHHPLILGSDHAGFKLKEILKRYLQKQGHPVRDLSPKLTAGDDYPLVAKRAAKVVAKDAHTQAILVCGTGLGMDIAANRTKGVRAVVVRNIKEAKLSREHNHSNILVLGEWLTPQAVAKKIVDVWLKTPYSTATRHVRRVRQLDQA